MEIIPIGNSKIKISLTYDDLEKYSLSCEKLDYDTTETRRAFWSILDDVKRSSGFDAAKSRIMIRLFTCPDGSCEMFITKMPLPSRDEVICIKDPMTSVATRTFAFDCFDDLVRACTLLGSLEYRARSSAYRGNGLYYLTLSCPEVSTLSDRGDISYPDLLCEFSRPLDRPYTPEYISEHFTPLCRADAITHLARG